MNNQISPFNRVPSGVAVSKPQCHAEKVCQPTDDGHVDSVLLNGLGEQALSGVHDERLQATLQMRDTRDGMVLGVRWYGIFRNTAVFNHRRMMGTEEQSVFRLDDKQRLEIDWSKRNLNLMTVAAGQRLEIEATFDSRGVIAPESIKETHYLLAK